MKLRVFFLFVCVGLLQVSCSGMDVQQTLQTVVPQYVFTHRYSGTNTDAEHPVRCSFGPNGMLATTHTDDTVCTWSLAQKQCITKKEYFWPLSESIIGWNVAGVAEPVCVAGTETCKKMQQFSYNAEQDLLNKQAELDSNAVWAAFWDVNRKHISIAHTHDEHRKITCYTSADAPAQQGHMAWHPHKALLAYCFTDMQNMRKKSQTLRFFDVHTKKDEPILQDATIEHIAFNLHGSHLAYARKDHSLVVLDVARKKPLYSLVGHTKNVCDIVWHPHNNTVLASVSRDQTARVWQLPEIKK